MSKNIQDIILSSKLGKIGILVFAVYTLAWGIIEPLGLEWIENHKTIWRILLLSFSAIVTAILSIRLTSSLLDKIDSDGPDRTLQESYSSTGMPTVTVFQDAKLGNVVNIKGQYHKDELDWAIKSSAQKASVLEVIFKNNRVFYFYLRIVMLSQNGQIHTTRWIRFDNSIVTPDIYINDPHEMGIHYDSDLFNGYNKATISIKEAVQQTYGQAGWIYDKIMLFRVRCDDGTVKSVIFKK